MAVGQLDRETMYDVRERTGFQSDWARGVSEGWINPMADANTLQALRVHLARSPHAAPVIPGLPDNVRLITFPRSATHSLGRVELRYEIVEDDLKVWLESMDPVS